MEAPRKEIEVTFPTDAKRNPRFPLGHLLLSILVAAALLYFVVRGVRPADFISRFASFSASGIILGVVMYYLSYIARAARFMLMLRRNDILLSAFPALSILLSSFALNCIVPAKAGDLYRAYYVKRKTSAGFFTVLGVIVAERACDLLAVLSVIGLSAAGVALLPSSYEAGSDLATKIIPAALIVLALLTAVVLLLLNLEKLARFLAPKKYRNEIVEVRDGFYKSLSFPAALILLTGLVWLLELGSFGAILASGGINPGIAQTLFAASASTLSNAVPFTPGGLGAYELAAREILVSWSYEPALVIAAIAILRLVSYWGLMAVGALFALASLVTGRRKA